MPTLIPLFLFLHVLSIAIWIAAALWLAGDVRRTLALGKPHVDALATRVVPQLGLDSLGAGATFLTGILLLGAESWAPPRPGVAVGIVLAAGRVAVLATMRRHARGILARLRAGEAVDPKDPAARRMSMLAGIAHGLWLLVLAAMIFPI